MPVPKKKSSPNFEKLIESFGVIFEKTCGKERVCDCPFCGTESKFSMDVETGRQNCWACDYSGNHISFIRELHRQSLQSTRENDYKNLSKLRGPFSKGYRSWQICKSHINGDWLIAGYNSAKKLVQLYRWQAYKKLYATAGLGHGLFGINALPTDYQTIDICEGPWDGMAWYQATESRKGHAVIAVPGCNQWKPEWNKLIAGKDVRILFDSDYPKTNSKTGQQMQPVGFCATKRLAQKIKLLAKSVSFLNWGPEGFAAELKDGCDIRDILMERE